jgi:signal transduction histidine kinase
VVFLITVVLSSVFPQKLVSFYDPAVVTFVFISVSIMAVYPVIFSNINSMSEAAMKREVEAQNAMLLSQIEAENAMIAADSQSRHDRRHHNLVMLEFARNNDVESVKEYLQNLVDGETEVWGNARYCDHTTVNTVITVYERRARENGIKVNVFAVVSNNIELPPRDLVIVIANLFENAINATEKLKGGDKVIDISIKEGAQRLLIKIDNTCRDKMTFDKSSYGIGIQSVIAVANKYDGMYDFSVEDGIFSAKVTLNLQ